MKAVDFIRKFGWSFAIALSNKGEELIDFRPYEIGRGFINDLKKYTNAYQLVQNFGGIESSREVVGTLTDKYQSYTLTRDDTGFTCKSGDLNKAITLVEEVGV